MKATVAALQVNFSNLQSREELHQILDIAEDFRINIEIPSSRAGVSLGWTPASGSGSALIHAAALLMRFNMLGGQVSVEEMLAHLRRDLEAALDESDGPGSGDRIPENAEGLEIEVTPGLMGQWPHAGDEDNYDLSSDD